MSLESFFGLDQSDTPGSQEASEKFREQMAANARAIKSMSAHQAQQKTKEDRLAKILVKYLQDSSRADLVFLIVKLLQENVPGAFILAVLSLGDAELEQELKKSFAELGAQEAEALRINEESALPMKQMPESVQADFAAWGQSILQAGLLMPGKTLDSVLTPDQKLKSLILDILEYALEEYFNRHGLDANLQNTRPFALLSIQAVLLRLREKHSQMSDAEILESPSNVTPQA